MTNRRFPLRFQRPAALPCSSTGTICRRVSNPTLQNEMLVYGCTMYSKDDGSVLKVIRHGEKG